METEQIKALNEVLVDTVKNQRESYKGLVKAFIITILCYTVLLVTMVIGFFIYESQFEYVTTETITQEVSGEGSEINNIEGNQYNDNAVHNEQ